MSKKRKIEAAAAQQAARGPQEIGDARGGKKARVFGSPVRNLFVTALVSVLLGAAFFLKPTLLYTYSGLGIGGLVALVGLIYIIIYFARKPVSGVYHSEFAIGLVLLCAGAYVALGGYIENEFMVSLTFATLVRIIGVLIAADGLMKLQYSLDIARMHYTKWWIVLLMSIIGIALGIATAFGVVYAVGTTSGLGVSSFSSGMKALGLGFALNCLIDLISLIVIATRNRKARREAEIEEAAAALLAQQAAAQAAAAPVAAVPAPTPAPAPSAVPEVTEAPAEAE